jgi:hypothetical protein
MALLTSKVLDATSLYASQSQFDRFNDDLNKIRGDPLFAVKMREKKAREEVLKNPVLMAKIRRVCSLMSHRNKYSKRSLPRLRKLL